ncbi:MAG: Gfo/Idh/MocA family oxidoreductase [Pirellulaceae bacterium]|nr:Gfo/Idh/MocA family oxidoreductase [Pirellulaceae bacterium]
MKRILIVGVGSIGLRHLRCFRESGRADLSFCEVNPELRAQVAEEYRVGRSYGDLESALDAGEYDAAVIATPAHLHIVQAVRLAEAGLDLFIEKPLSTSLDRIDELRRALREKRLISAVAYVYRANPVLAAMKAAIAEGRFGRPLEVVAVAGQHFPTYRPLYREIYYRDRATGGGAIQDALTHVLNAGEWLVGPIDRLVADAGHQALEGVSVEDTAHILTRHGEVLGTYSLNQHQAPNEMTITVVCERGTARFEGHLARWRWMLKPDDPWRDEPAEPLARDELFVRQANAFLDALDGREQPLCSLEEGLQTLRVNLAALASLETGAWQSIA